MNELGSTKGWGKSLNQAILAGILFRIGKKVQGSAFQQDQGDSTSMQNATSETHSSQRAVF